jgi:hypothetical protein
MPIAPQTALNAAGVAFPTAWELVGGVNYSVSVLALADGTQIGAGSPLPVSGTVTLGAASVNIGDVDVLTVPTIATTTRALDYSNGVTVTAGASSSASAAIAATEIYIHNAGAVRAYIRQGSGTPTASVAATSLAMEPGEKICLRHTSGHAVAAIRDGASDCAIRITPAF